MYQSVLDMLSAKYISSLRSNYIGREQFLFVGNDIHTLIKPSDTHNANYAWSDDRDDSETAA
jgi:hypothetical protein